MLPTPSVDPSLVPSESFDRLLDQLRDRRLAVLAGAGCSTESGIPDYRGGDGRMRERSPIQYGEFVGRAEARARYWARSVVGWPRFRGTRPNPAHEALARLEAGGVVLGIITQNVDGLHQAAGSRRVVELHGSLAGVRCLGCGGRTSRDEVQERLLHLNRDWMARLEARLESRTGEAVQPAPDGDAELPTHAVDGFQVPSCVACGGVLKPDVVLFGENVPKARVDEAWRLFEAADTLLVAGSSLTVYSGRRFVYRARQTGVPVVIVNIGPTRADEIAAAKVEGRLGAVLPRVARALLP